MGNNIFCQCHIYLKHICKLVNGQVHLQCCVLGEVWYLVSKGDNFETKTVGQIACFCPEFRVANILK